MDSSYLTTPVIFLIDILFSLYILAVVLRFLLQWVNADFYNPYAQFLVKITHPPLRYLRRFIPPIGKIDTSCIVFALLLQMFAIFSILFLQGVSPSISALTLKSLIDLITLFINIFIFCVFARALLSWFNPGTYNAVSSILYSLTEPILYTCRKILPIMAGMDLSPLVALIGLQVAKMLILPPLVEILQLIN